MPIKELKLPSQINNWLTGWGKELKAPGEMILIGSGAILWHAFQQGINTPLPENSMDVDPITDCEEIAEMCYDCLIGSEFEQKEGWHINLMPKSVLQHLPEGWEERVDSKTYGRLTVIVPSLPDLMAPKLQRGEPRDRKHGIYAHEVMAQEQRKNYDAPSEM